MKKLFTLLMPVVCAITAFGQTTYNVNSNSSWSSLVGGSCWTCTFNIASGVTLTVNSSVTCGTCTFNGGSINITSDLVCQPCAFSNNTITMTNAMLKPNSSTSSFSGVTLTANGTAYILANTAVNVTNSNLVFKNTSYFSNNSSTLTMVNSSMTFNDNTYFFANGGPVNLKSTSQLIAGDGTISSAAYIKLNGPTLNIYDNSSITLKNNKNYYFNWSAYNTPTIGGSVSTASLSMNCGGASPQNACSAPNIYGCATLSSAGAVACTILPVDITAFSATRSNDDVLLNWTVANLQSMQQVTVEKSTNGSDWRSVYVGTPADASADGAFRFADEQPGNDRLLYRLVLSAANGTITYSQVVTVSALTATGQLNIFPNPVRNGHFTLQVAATTTTRISVSTLQGVKLYQAAFSGATNYAVDLPANIRQFGFLVIQVVNGTSTKTFTVLNQ